MPTSARLILGPSFSARTLPESSEQESSGKKPWQEQEMGPSGCQLGRKPSEKGKRECANPEELRYREPSLRRPALEGKVVLLRTDRPIELFLEQRFPQQPSVPRTRQKQFLGRDEESELHFSSPFDLQSWQPCLGRDASPCVYPKPPYQGYGSRGNEQDESTISTTSYSRDLSDRNVGS